MRYYTPDYVATLTDAELENLHLMKGEYGSRMLTRWEVRYIDMERLTRRVSSRQKTYFNELNT